MVDLEFFKNKKVFITGHTGFKGTWMSKVLIDNGAVVSGYSLEPEENGLFQKTNLSRKMKSTVGDIRDFEKLQKTVQALSPEIVIHLAAQPIVRMSYEDPRYTYETNVMGTVNVLECIRNTDSVKSFLNVTTDKVYENLEKKNAFREEDKLNGIDPYSNSKSCSELVTSSYQKSFLNEKGIAVSTARAGNVIGGGDSAAYRIIPDCIRAAKKKEKIVIRNPNSVRPYQHVLDALLAYLMIVQKQYENPIYSGNYNVGPNLENIITTKEMVEIFCKTWGNEQSYVIQGDNGPYESSYLQLDCQKIKETFGWNQVWNIEKSVQAVVAFERKSDDTTLEKTMESQILEFEQDMRK